MIDFEPLTAALTTFENVVSQHPNVIFKKFHDGLAAKSIRYNCSKNRQIWRLDALLRLR
jgi:hypothetical protein